MPSDFWTFFSQPSSLIDWIKLIGLIFSVLGGGGLIGYGTNFIRIFSLYRERKNLKILKKQIPEDIQKGFNFDRSTRYYIKPDCQTLDPANAIEPQRSRKTKKLFALMDKTLKNPSKDPYIMLLSDTGMGKSSFFLNYYAHLLRRKRKFKAALFSLNDFHVDKRIESIKEPEKTILFLDALDEDIKAKDHEKRLQDIVNLTCDFRNILITCRSQFYSKDDELPKFTGIPKSGPRTLGENREYEFSRLYLSPFSDEQVESYIKRRYPIWKLTLRHNARKIVEKIPRQSMTIRPLVLSYIIDLPLKEKEYNYSFELYEEIINGWLEREEDPTKAINKELLRDFSEQLAVDIYLNREQRGAEHISYMELETFKEQRNINIDERYLTGRTLLNRDAVGNWKFAHRSFMEYLVVMKFANGDKSCVNTEWTNQMKSFLRDIIQHKIQIGEAIKFDCRYSKRIFQCNLRSIPKENLNFSDVTRLQKKYCYIDSDGKKKGKSIDHLYELKEEFGEMVVVDYATGLIWKQLASVRTMSYKEAKNYLNKLNRYVAAMGKKKWRFPTIEEAMSLIERNRRNDGTVASIYIDSVFDNNECMIWTSDTERGSNAWGTKMGYSKNFTVNSGGDLVYVRAVRSGQ